MTTVSRRHVMQVAAVAATAGPLLRTGRAKASETADVVVIGAGLSGLNAAWILSEAGLDVVVLEGASRIGGRVWTAHESESAPDLGASQVGPSYARTLDAIDRLGLKLIDEDRAIMPFTYHLEGQLIRAKDWADHPVNKTVGAERKLPPISIGNTMLAKLNPMKELDDWLKPELSALDAPIGELFRKAGVSPAAEKLAGLTQELWSTSALGMMQEAYRGAYEARFAGGSNASRPDQQRVESAPQLEKWPKNIVGGTDLLPQRMAGQLKRPVMLNKIVGGIDMDASGADVTCIDGTKVRAKYVISAVPFSTLRHISITPAPDKLHRTAIDEMGYAETTRAFATFAEPFWQQDGLDPSLFTDTAIRMVWMLDNHSGKPNAPTKGPFRAMFVMTWRTAERVAMLSPDEASKFLVDEFTRIRPAAKGLVKINRFHSWGRQPLQRGCRHIFKPGQVTAFAVDMIKPVERLHFAGEHTRRLEQGMESAMESGERAAIEVLERA
jgi:monoamine oxidase